MEEKAVTPEVDMTSEEMDQIAGGRQSLGEVFEGKGPKCPKCGATNTRLTVHHIICYYCGHHAWIG